MSNLRSISGQAWVAVGDETNWERGLENGIWGLAPQLENHWLRIEPGDLVLFYCTAPVSGFVGGWNHTIQVPTDHSLLDSRD